MPTRLPTLIYVTGLAYSGTTLLSSALGNSNGFFNAGEVNYLENDYHPDKRCSCGRRITDCDVWRAILDVVRNQAGQSRTLNFSSKQSLREIDRRSLPLKTKVLLLFGRRPEQLFDRSELEDYALRHCNFIGAVAAATKAKYVIDASKNFTRLYVLSHYTELPIHVIYLRRSLIQIYASRLKRAKRRNRHYYQILAPLYLCVILFRVRELRRRLSSLAPGTVSVVDYESFVENPQSIEAQLNADLNSAVDLGIRNGELSLRHLHAYTGNIWLSDAAKAGTSVKVRKGESAALLSWLERGFFEMLSPIIKRVL